MIRHPKILKLGRTLICPGPTQKLNRHGIPIGMKCWKTQILELDQSQILECQILERKTRSTTSPGMIRHQMTSRAREAQTMKTVSYTHLRAHETPEHLVCRLLLEKKK